MSFQPPSPPTGPGAAGLHPGAGLQGLGWGLRGAEEPPGDFALHEDASPLAKQQHGPLGLGFHVGCAKIFGHLSHLGVEQHLRGPMRPL